MKTIKDIKIFLLWVEKEMCLERRIKKKNFYAGK